jgi:hypothetical protein
MMPSVICVFSSRNSTVFSVIPNITISELSD